jgi:hypothetical protein
MQTRADGETNRLPDQPPCCRFEPEAVPRRPDTGVDTGASTSARSRAMPVIVTCFRRAARHLAAGSERELNFVPRSTALLLLDELAPSGSRSPTQEQSSGSLTSSSELQLYRLARPKQEPTERTYSRQLVVRVTAAPVSSALVDAMRRCPSTAAAPCGLRTRSVHRASPRRCLRRTGGERRAGSAPPTR